MSHFDRDVASSRIAIECRFVSPDFTRIFLRFAAAPWIYQRVIIMINQLWSWKVEELKDVKAPLILPFSQGLVADTGSCGFPFYFFTSFVFACTTLFWLDHQCDVNKCVGWFLFYFHSSINCRKSSRDFIGDYLVVFMQFWGVLTLPRLNSRGSTKPSQIFYVLSWHGYIATFELCINTVLYVQ